jgi:hypothetical protein
VSTTISTTSDEDSTSTPVSSNSAGYVIKNYDMNIVVGVDNVFHIQETIDVNFTLKSHGIYRDIPIVNNIKREDGSTTKQVAKVSNLKVNDQYSTTKNNGMFSIKIGNPNKYISGEKSYIISYDYNLGKDSTKKFDELYFNLIGTEWTTTIEKVTFKVQMPKSFDETKLGFSKGYKGSIGYEGVEFSVNENTITGYTTERLYSKQALTIRLELPENYFSEAKRIGIGYLIVGFGVPLLAVVFAYLIFYKAKKHNRYVSAV